MSLYHHDYNNRLRDVLSPKEERTLFIYATIALLALAAVLAHRTGVADWIISLFA